MKFIFHDEVYEIGVRGAYYRITGMRNSPSTHPEILEFVDTQLSAVSEDREYLVALRGFTDLHAAVSRRPDRLVTAPASLLAFYQRQRDIPRINGIVDVYNAVSLRSGLAIGAHDLQHVAGNIELKLTTGNENFWPIGASQASRVASGEYAYIDGSNDILCRLEVRQVEKTKITLESRDVFFIVQGHKHMETSDIQRSAVFLATSSVRLFGGHIKPLYGWPDGDRATSLTHQPDSP
jgi:DNA/RNA-binding domain of Phe-tRNA-synthetase-like protein